MSRLIGYEEPAWWLEKQYDEGAAERRIWSCRRLAEGRWASASARARWWIRRHAWSALDAGDWSIRDAG